MVTTDRFASAGQFPIFAAALCDNPRKTCLSMRLSLKILTCLMCVTFAAAVGSVAAWAKAASQAQGNASSSVPLVLAGGTLVDVTGWGHSAHDLQDAVVIVRDGRITEVGTAAEVVIPKGARVIDCTGKFILPGLVDGYAGMNSQGQANANLYLGVTTVVVRNDHEHGQIDFSANPRPHLYAIDSVGATDNWSLLAKHTEWQGRLKEGKRSAELSPEDTNAQLNDTARLGTRVVLLGHRITAANTQLIIARAHQLGLVTYGEFVATPYTVGVEAGVDNLLHMEDYDLGVVPDELQRPLVEDPDGPSASTALDYSQRLPPTDSHVRAYAQFLSAHHAALMPTFSLNYVDLPGHRNLWKEPAAAILDPARMSNPSNPATGEMDYPLSYVPRHLPAVGQRWFEESLRRKATQDATRMWLINETIYMAYPRYLAASGAPVDGTMPGISLHTELELLVRLGLSPREALAAATNNYALQFGWNELGLVAPGRRADIVVVDGDPTANIWNARRISGVIVDGEIVDRDALLKVKR
jgi:hypothetical protein